MEVICENTRTYANSRRHACVYKLLYHIPIPYVTTIEAINPHSQLDILHACTCSTDIPVYPTTVDVFVSPATSYTACMHTAALHLLGVHHNPSIATMARGRR